MTTANMSIHGRFLKGFDYLATFLSDKCITCIKLGHFKKTVKKAIARL